MKTLHSYIQEIDGKIPSFNIHCPDGCSTSSYWREDGGKIELSKSVTASFEQVDEHAEKLGLDAWINQH
jgi:hypothetical protein